MAFFLWGKDKLTDLIADVKGAVCRYALTTVSCDEVLDELSLRGLENMFLVERCASVQLVDSVCQRDLCDVVLKRTEGRKIVDEVRTRDLVSPADLLSDGALKKELDARGIHPLFGQKPKRLVHELRRQAFGVDVPTYYGGKKRGVPTCKDSIGAILTEKEGGVTTRSCRGGKRIKMINHFIPKNWNDGAQEAVIPDVLVTYKFNN